MLQVILDVETQKKFDEVGGNFPDRLGISFVGACIREGFAGKGEMKGFFEDDLGQLFPILEKADVLIGYNIDSFDMQTFVPYYSGDVTQLPTLDLLTRIKDAFGYRIKLDSVAQETLGVGKSGNGLDAIEYYRNGELDKLRDYCLQDVAVTRDIYDYGLKHGRVKFKNKWNRPIDTEVDFSFTPSTHTGVQMSLL